MTQLPDKLTKKLDDRKAQNSFRQLKSSLGLVDFASNDYLGLGASELCYQRAHEIAASFGLVRNGSGGSRLLTGNTQIHLQIETQIANFHQAEAALLFNSGYDANIALMQSLPQRTDVILYDELCHASIRDGIRLSHARSVRFKHNNLKDIESHLRHIQENSPDAVIYVVSESIFSMDGDQAPMFELAKLCDSYNTRLIVDEAHALGVIGENGIGLIASLGLEASCFARLYTYGKAMGAHGAAVVGSADLKAYLVNFARSFIYSTALPPLAVAAISASYEHLESRPADHKKLNQNITFFRKEVIENSLKDHFIDSLSAIQSMVLPGNSNVKTISEKLKANDFDVRPILAPTVSEGQERLRICLHSYNSETSIKHLVQLLANFVE